MSESRSPDAPRAGEAPAIRAERVAATFVQTPLAVIASLFNAVLMAAVMAPPGHRWPHFVWFAAMVGIGLVRLAIWHAHATDAKAEQRSATWSRLSIATGALAGMGWGGGLVFLWPPEEAGQLFWAFLICGMCAGAVAVHAAHMATAMAFVLPSCLPLAVAFIVTGTDRSLVAAAMTVTFVVTLWISARRSSRLFGAYIGTRETLARQAAALDAANASLRDEIALHRATEESLRHAQKMEAVGRLTGGIAHDFNNLLTAVLGSIALVQKRLPDAEPRIARLLANARQAAERGAALTQRLLAFGRQQALNTAPVDLGMLIGGMSDLLRGSLGGAIRIETAFPAGLPPVMADANQIELAVLNLALNARDAMPSGGTISISAEERGVGPGEEPGLAPGGYVVLSLADTGTGMDEATLARAMEPFFTTKEIGKGTGLGLSMVHGMAAQSGGRLALHSEPGAGTTAAIWLPRAAPGARQTAAARPASQAEARGATVLLVDDDPLVLGSTAAMLEDLGYAVRSAGTPRQALDLLARPDPIALLLTGCGMPDMHGAELAARARVLRPGLPVLVAHGHGDPPGSGDAGLARLARPFSTESLAAALAAQLGTGQRATQAATL